MRGVKAAGSDMAETRMVCRSPLFFFNDTATTEIYTLSLHDALPISTASAGWSTRSATARWSTWMAGRYASSCPNRSEEHTSELQSRQYLVCRLLLEKKRKPTTAASAALDVHQITLKGQCHHSTSSPI